MPSSTDRDSIRLLATPDASGAAGQRGSGAADLLLRARVLVERLEEDPALLGTVITASALAGGRLSL